MVAAQRPSRVHHIWCQRNPIRLFNVLTQDIGPLAESVLAGASLVSVDMARTVAEREEKLDDAAAESLVSVRA